MRILKEYNICRAFLLTGVVSSIVLGMVRCKEFEPERRLLVRTDSILTVEGRSFAVEGSLIFIGESDIEQHGFCYSENNQPDINNSTKSELGARNSRGTFETTFVNLSGNTTYYVRAYAQDANEIAYGEIVQLQTNAAIPAILTSAISSVTQTTAQSGGEIKDDGGGQILSKGVCWSPNSNPTIDDSLTTDGSGTASFVSKVEGLQCNVKYYLRAYATNSAGTGYGNTINFTTSACEDTKLATVSTSEVNSVTETSAVCGGNVSDDGGTSVIERGVCWSTETQPTLDEDYMQSGNGTGSFNLTITGLACGTTYYARAYAKNASGIAYGLQISFNTSECSAALPTLSTSIVTDIGQTEALSGGNITDDGGAAVTARGVCWSLEQDPTLTDPHTTDGAGSGAFNSTIFGLSPGTTYFVRAYATNSSGTAYGNEHLFTTEGQTLPKVTTSAVSNITQTSATSGGNVVQEGSESVSSRGVCWSTSPNPTISDEHTTDGAGPGSYTSQIQNLTCGTTYYVRAYAISTAGVAYGAEESFTTLNCSSGKPEVTTTTITNITPSSAQSGGEIISEGGSGVKARGICWSTSPSPDISDPKTEDGTGPGVFVSQLTGLEVNTQYYVRAYATNDQGTAYGEELSFNTNPDMLTDIDGNAYNTIMIGDQTWMAENLRVTRFADGASIPLVENSSMWDDLGPSDKAYCWNDNNAATGVVYGGLYTWAAATKGVGSISNPSGIQGVCPTGWHLPSDSEWKQLEEYLGMEQAEADLTGWRGTDEGGMLKESGKDHWNDPNTGATNSSGFTALPGGNRYDYGSFYNVGNSALFWTTTESDRSSSYARVLSYNLAKIYRSSYDNKNGFSVRCVKDD